MVYTVYGVLRVSFGQRWLTVFTKDDFLYYVPTIVYQVYVGPSRKWPVLTSIIQERSSISVNILHMTSLEDQLDHSSFRSRGNIQLSKPRSRSPASIIFRRPNSSSWWIRVRLDWETWILGMFCSSVFVINCCASFFGFGLTSVSR